MNPTSRELTSAVLACLFAALTALGAFMAIPIPGSPVPIVLQNLFIMLSALILGPWWSLMSTTIYLGFGLIGMPVFSAGSSGLTALLGPTGGYLLGYLPASLAIGYLARLGRKRLWMNAVACSFGMLIVYALGVSFLKLRLDLSWQRAFTAGMLPFLPGDIAKIVLAALLAPRIIKGLDALELTGSDG
jgi:biotin transport system substrate-specific component